MLFVAMVAFGIVRKEQQLGNTILQFPVRRQMMTMTLTPEQLSLTGTRILVRKYEKPEQIGSILLNPAWRTDHSRALWEVVKSGEGADKLLGLRLQPDWILITPPERGVYCSEIDLGGPDAFFVLAEEVAKIIPWILEEENA